MSKSAVLLAAEEAESMTVCIAVLDSCELMLVCSLEVSSENKMCNDRVTQGIDSHSARFGAVKRALERASLACWGVDERQQLANIGDSR